MPTFDIRVSENRSSHDPYAYHTTVTATDADAAKAAAITEALEDWSDGADDIAADFREFAFVTNIRETPKRRRAGARTAAGSDSAERLHPDSLHQLRQLVKLHGAPRIRAALDTIERDDTSDAASEATGGKYS